MNIKINDIITDETNIQIKHDEDEVIIDLNDVIGFDKENVDGEKPLTLYYIQPTNDGSNVLTKKEIIIEGSPSELQTVYSTIKNNVSKVSQRPKSVVVFVNPISGSANSESIFNKQVVPLLTLAEIQYKLIVLEGKEHAIELIRSFDFSPYNALVIIGGDGTVNTVLNTYMLRRQTETGTDIHDQSGAITPIDIPIAYIPGGTGNGMSVITHGCYDVTTATLQLIRGKIRDGSGYGNYSNGKLVAYSFQQTAFGMFSEIVQACDRNRWMRKLRYPVMMLYFFLWQTLRIFTCEIEYIEDDSGDLSQDGASSNTKVTTTMELFNVLILDGNGFLKPKYDEKEKSQIDTNKFMALFFKPMSRLQLMKAMYALVRAARGKDELEEASNIEIKYMKGLHMKVNNSVSEYDLLLNLDGDIYHLDKPEVYVRFIPSMYKVITSYSPLDTPVTNG